MGWTGGTEIAQTVIEAVKLNVHKKAARRAIYELFYYVMSQHDWDGEQESFGIDPVWDELMSSYGYEVDD